MKPEYETLEIEFGEWCGNPNCVAVSSGTSALQIACTVAMERLLMNPYQDHEIYMPDFTMIACARAAVMAGLKPRFMDCDDNLLMDFHSAAQVDLVMPVHIYGRKYEVSELLAHPSISEETLIIEDLAEAPGIEPHPKSFAACWSFYRNKIIRGEEGGMIAFRDSEDAKLAKCLRSLGFDARHDFTHLPYGMNARMSNLHATPILASLREYHRSVNRRREAEIIIDENLPDSWKLPYRNEPWVYDFRIKGLTTTIQNSIVEDCRSAGVEIRHGFKRLSTQPEFKGTYWCDNPNAEKASREVMYLPLDPDRYDPLYDVTTLLEVCRRYLDF